MYIMILMEHRRNSVNVKRQSSENSFVTVPLRDEFMENAGLFIFEAYCRIHQCFDIRMLSQKLNMSYDDAERWIVNLIRNACLDAKIGSKTGTVVMGSQHPNIYELRRPRFLGKRSYPLTTKVVLTNRAVTNLFRGKQSPHGFVISIKFSLF